MLFTYDYACNVAGVKRVVKYETLLPLENSGWFNSDDAVDHSLQGPEWNVTSTTLRTSGVTASVQTGHDRQSVPENNILPESNHLMCSLSEHTRMTRQIASDTRSIEQFSFILSHKLRVPIANALGLAELLDGNLISDSEREDCQKHLCASVREIDNEIRAMNEVVSHYRTRMTES